MLSTVLTACGHDENIDRGMPTPSLADLLSQTTITAEISWREGGDPAPAYCEDGNSCVYCHTNTLDNVGRVSQTSSCVRNGVSSISDSNAGTACKTAVTQTQVDAESLTLVKQKILQIDPLSLADSYDCDLNDSCYADGGSYSVTISIDQNTRIIGWSDGGAKASTRFSNLLNLLHGIGM